MQGGVGRDPNMEESKYLLHIFLSFCFHFDIPVFGQIVKRECESESGVRRILAALARAAILICKTTQRLSSCHLCGESAKGSQFTWERSHWGDNSTLGCFIVTSSLLLVCRKVEVKSHFIIG